MNAVIGKQLDLFFLNSEKIFKFLLFVRHDICYGKCYGKNSCDDQFNDCLSDACRQMPFVRRQLCYMDKNGMVMAVRLFGRKFYCVNKTFHEEFITIDDHVTDSEP